MSRWMKQLLIVKFGGSIITYKESQIPKPRITVIKRLTKELAKVARSGNYKILLVHGAGSYGHPIVRKHNLHRGMRTKLQSLAFGKTLQNMLSLNKIVVDCLIANLIPAASLPPHTFVAQSEGKFKGFDSSLIGRYLASGQMPILFGDVVLDDKWGCSILSGDTIVSYLAREFKAETVIFLSDVDGIFEEDPRKNPDAKIIPKITNGNYHEVIAKLSPESSANVTGEMHGKVTAIKDNLKGIKVLITNGLRPGSLINSLQGKSKGTELCFT